MDTLVEYSRHIEAGGIVAYPTETVWGLGASIYDSEAVKKIFLIKGRSFNQPLSVLVRDVEIAKKLVMLNQKEKLLLKAFWPGPFSFIFPALDKELAAQLGSKDGTLCLRCSNHDLVKKMVLFMKTPVVTTSANRTGEPPAKDVNDLGWLPEHVKVIDDKVRNRPEKRPSTILQPSGTSMQLIRRGDIEEDDLSNLLSKLGYELKIG